MQSTSLKNMIDIGANLAAKDFDADLQEVLQAGFEAGVGKVIITGSCFESIPKAQKIIGDYKQEYKNRLFYTAGIHPHHSDEWNQNSSDFIKKFVQDEYCVATGEMGLDFFRNFVDKEIQIATFRAQLDLAIEVQKPIFIHERDASDTMLKELKNRAGDLPKNIVIHCFTGNRMALEAYLEAGFYIGITGWICDPVRGAHLLDLVKIIPQDKIMIETDAPYLLPKTIKPKPKSRRNEPKNLGFVAQKISDALEVDTQDFIDKTSANAIAFFGLDRFE